MSKIIGGIFCLIGTLGTIYCSFIFMNTSWVLDYNDPKKHLDMAQTGYLPGFMAFLLMAIIGYTFMFLAKEDNPDLKQ